MPFNNVTNFILVLGAAHICAAFVPRESLSYSKGRTTGFKEKNGHLFSSSLYADDSISISHLDNTEPGSIQKASDFMTDNFWLPNEDGKHENKNYENLSASVHDDLLDRYGERMKQGKLDSGILQAHTIANPSELAGLVGIDVAVLDSQRNVIFNREKSDSLLTNAVASLGPKDRKRYMRSSAQKIATKLLPPELSAVVVLSNLAVSTSLRRMRIGAKLCTEAELFASVKGWGFTEIYLKVESENVPAKTLYERLGYEERWVENNAIALRADLDSGEFIEKIKDTTVMSKFL